MLSYNDLILLEDSRPIMYANKCIIEDKGPNYHIISFIWRFLCNSINCDLQNRVNRFIFFFQVTTFFFVSIFNVLLQRRNRFRSQKHYIQIYMSKYITFSSDDQWPLITHRIIVVKTHTLFFFSLKVFFLW